MIGVILSGGENRRIPVLKAFLTVAGEPIIEGIIRTLGKVFDRIVISTNMPERYFRFGVPLIGDVRKEKCPMNGILSTLVATGEDSVFVTACDMPFVNENLIRYMVERYCTESAGQGAQEYDAVIPVFRGKREPLFGIYTKSVMSVFEKNMERGERSLMEILTDLCVRYVTDEEVKGVDPAGESFVNINTMEDYERIGGKTCLV